MKINTYDIINESCPNCDNIGEMSYIINCNACVCGNCGRWIDIDGTILEEE